MTVLTLGLNLTTETYGRPLFRNCYGSEWHKLEPKKRRGDRGKTQAVNAAGGNTDMEGSKICYLLAFDCSYGVSCYLVNAGHRHFPFLLIVVIQLIPHASPISS